MRFQTNKYTLGKNGLKNISNFWKKIIIHFHSVDFYMGGGEIFLQVKKGDNLPYKKIEKVWLKTINVYI